MLTFEQAQEKLTAIADAMPREIFRELNGGILLLPKVEIHPESVGGGLYILGRYHYDPRGFGRYITIYYGSFLRAYGHLPDRMQEEKLKEVLCHELIHHLEHLAGDKSLEIRDELDILRYLRGKRNNP